MGLVLLNGRKPKYTEKTCGVKLDNTLPTKVALIKKLHGAGIES